MAPARLHTHIGSGEGSQIEYDIYVEDGRVFYQTENTGFAFMRNGAESSTREITLQDLKENTVRGGKYYEAAKLEVERQQALLQSSDAAGQPSE